MKKLLSVLIALCLLCTAATATAETAPAYDDMPAVVVEDDDTTIEKSAFDGTWTPDKAFVSGVYINLETLASTYNLTVPTIRIEDGSFCYSDTGEGGETVEKEYACTFQAGQLQGEDEAGLSFCFDLLEDGNITMAIFLPGEDDTPIEVDIFFVRASA